MPKRKTVSYSFSQSLEMLGKLQEMAIAEGNINLALKAEELKCKVAALQSDKENSATNESLTKILVDFINDKQNNSEDTGDICAAAADKMPV